MKRLIDKITIIDFVFFAMLALFFLAPDHLILSMVANTLAAAFCVLVLMDQWEGFKIYSFSMIYAVFAFLCFISYFYSIHASQSMERIISVPLLLLLFCVGLNYFSKEDNLQKFMLMYVSVALLSCAYLLVTDDVFSGETVGWAITNTNIMGTRFAFAVVFMVYFLLQKVQWWRLLITVILITFLLLTASRSSTFIMVVSSVLLIIVTYRQKKKSVAVAIIVAITLVLLLLYLIFNVEFLYQILGVRLEGVLSLINTGEGDSSSKKRLALVRYGWQLFQEHPFFGQGINTFISDTRQSLGFAAYSHNNYLELLVGVGLVGTITYYLLPLTLLWNSFKLMRLEKGTSALGALVFAVMIGMFVSDVATVNYYSKTMLLMYMFSGAACIKYTDNDVKLQALPNKMQRRSL